jgi:hypothetical protein
LCYKEVEEEVCTNLRINPGTAKPQVDAICNHAFVGSQVTKACPRYCAYELICQNVSKTTAPPSTSGTPASTAPATTQPASTATTNASTIAATTTQALTTPVVTLPPATLPPTPPPVDKSKCGKNAAGEYFGYEEMLNTRIENSVSGSKTFPRLIDHDEGGLTKGKYPPGNTLEKCAAACDKQTSSTTPAKNCLSFSFRLKSGKADCILSVTDLLESGQMDASGGGVAGPTTKKIPGFNHYIKEANCTKDRRRARARRSTHKEIPSMSIADHTYTGDANFVKTYPASSAGPVDGLMFVDMQVNNFPFEVISNAEVDAQFRRAGVLAVADPDNDGDMDVLGVVADKSDVAFDKRLSTKLQWTRNNDDEKAGRCATLDEDMATYNAVCQSCAGDEVNCKP